jgi:hypothetical protein
MERTDIAPTPMLADDIDDDDDELSYETSGEEAQAPVPQVPAYIAIIRIIAVLGMGLSISFGLFIMLIGLRGVIIGIPIVLLAVPFYYGMQLAERLVARHEAAAPNER